MQTGEDIGGLRRIMDLTRLVSLFILAIHFYISCYRAFEVWHWTAAITDRIVSNLARTGLFAGWWRAKAGALLALAISLLGVKGKKDERINGKTITAYLVSGL